MHIFLYRGKMRKGRKLCGNGGMRGILTVDFTRIGRELIRELVVNFNSKSSNMFTCSLVYLSTILIAKACTRIGRELIRELVVNINSKGSHLSTCSLVYLSTILIAKACR